MQGLLFRSLATGDSFLVEFHHVDHFLDLMFDFFKTNQAIEFLKSILFLLWSRVSFSGWSHRCIRRLSRRNDLRIALGHFSANKIVTVILDFLGQITRIALPIGHGAHLRKSSTLKPYIGIRNLMTNHMLSHQHTLIKNAKWNGFGILIQEGCFSSQGSKGFFIDA